MNLKDFIVAAFFVTAFAHSGENVTSYTLTTGEVVEYRQLSPDRIEVLYWTWLNINEQTELIYHLAGGCIALQEKRRLPSLFDVVFFDRVLQLDCSQKLDRLSRPIGLMVYSQGVRSA